jgi:hypothetical protein
MVMRECRVQEELHRQCATESSGVFALRGFGDSLLGLLGLTTGYQTPAVQPSGGVVYDWLLFPACQACAGSMALEDVRKS